MKTKISNAGATPALSKEGNHNQIETKDYKMNKANKMLGGVMAMMLAGLGMLGVLMTGQDAQGATATITSSNFSLGYGFITGWDTSETAAANTPTTIGDFTFLPTLTGTKFSGGGPVFPNRVLSTGVSGSGSGYNSTFDIAGSWNGSAPLDAAALPNYQVTVTITDLKIWGYNWFGAPPELYFHETTAGHTADSSPIVPVNGNNNPSLASNWRQLVWDPSDYAIAGTNFTRAFSAIDTSAGQVALDGFEVLGSVSLTYDVVPEPASMGLVLAGLCGLMGMNRLRSRRTV